MHPVQTFALFVASAFLLTACGANEEASPDPTASAATAPTVASASATPNQGESAAPSNEADLKSAVTSYSDAFLTGDIAAYDLLSKRCRDRTSRNYFLGILIGAEDAYGSALPIKTFKADIQGTLARVTYKYDVVAINQDSEPWVKENGAWKNDDC